MMMNSTGFCAARSSSARWRCGHSAGAPGCGNRSCFRGDMSPDALVQSVSAEVLDNIKADPALRNGDFNKLQRLIDDKVAPSSISSG